VARLFRDQGEHDEAQLAMVEQPPRAPPASPVMVMAMFLPGSPAAEETPSEAPVVTVVTMFMSHISFDPILI